MNTPTKPKHKYNEEVSKIVNRVLREIFGKQATLVIYEYLEERYSLERDEIVERIDVFAKGLKEILRSGAYVIEKKILEDTYSSYGLTPRLDFERRINEYDFVSQMKTLRMS